MLNSTLSSLLAAQPAARGATQATAMLETCKRECRKFVWLRCLWMLQILLHLGLAKTQDVGLTAVVLPLESCVRPRA